MKKIFYHSDERIQQRNMYYLGVIGFISLCISFSDVMIRGFILEYSFSHWCVNLLICIVGSIYYLFNMTIENTHFPLQKKRAFYLYFYVVLFIVSVYILKDFYLHKMSIRELLLKFTFLVFADYITLLFLDNLLRKFKTK